MVARRLLDLLRDAGIPLDGLLTDELRSGAQHEGFAVQTVAGQRGVLVQWRCPAPGASAATAWTFRRWRGSRSQPWPRQVWLGYHRRKGYDHDVLVRLGGKVAKRNKQLSKAVYGTSHTISLAKANMSTSRGRRGCSSAPAGRHGRAVGAAAAFRRNRCQVQLLPTPEVMPV